MLQQIEELDDARLAAYRSLKDRDLAREGDRFIAEGEQVVRRLLSSGLPVESVLLARRRAAEIASIVPDAVPVYVVPDQQMQQVVGFKFHSGVMACGRRPPSPSIQDVLPADGPALLVICPEISNTENLGAIIRVSAGFGAAAIILGERSCDPFYRQAIRVSMGAVFSLPIVRSNDLMADLRWLKDHGKVELIASVLDKEAQSLDSIAPGRRVGVLFGNEAQGLDRKWIEACDQRVTIPMEWGTDSLNVAVAAGVVLYQMTRGGQR
jgi:tRNA G18 (ribose-2'-O)-methylase SpoU